MDSLGRYYRKLCLDYDACLRRIRRKADGESIHEVRLLIKKFRALYHLLANANSSFDFEKEFSSLQRFFKAAGKIRDIDIAFLIISEITKDSSFKGKKAIMEFLRTERRNFVRKIKKIVKEVQPAHGSSRSRDTRLFHQMQMKKVMTFLNRTVADIQIKKGKGKHLPAKRLHNIRKLCKEYLYVSQASGLHDEFVERTDALQKLIGSWHDYLITHEVLHALGKQADELLHQLKKEENKLKKKAINELRAIVS